MHLKAYVISLQLLVLAPFATSRKVWYTSGFGESLQSPELTAPKATHDLFRKDFKKRAQKWLGVDLAHLGYRNTEASDDVSKSISSITNYTTLAAQLPTYILGSWAVNNI